MDSDQFGSGIFVGMAVVAMLLVIGILGSIASDAMTRSDCDNYGKSKIRGQWYECKQLPEKK